LLISITKSRSDTSGHPAKTSNIKLNKQNFKIIFNLTILNQVYLKLLNQEKTNT